MRRKKKRSPSAHFDAQDSFDAVSVLFERINARATMTVTWADAGNPKVKLTLEDVRGWAMEYGFVKTNVPSDRPINQRVDLVAFFKVYNTNAFSMFKDKFKKKRLKPPNEAQVREPASRLVWWRETSKHSTDDFR